jgi:hypothetical protein
MSLVEAQRVSVKKIEIKARRGRWTRAGYAILDYAVLFSAFAVTSYSAYQMLHKALGRILGTVIADL